MTVTAGYMEHDGAGVVRLVDFIVNAYPHWAGNEREIDNLIKKVLKYKTGDYGVDEDGIVYVIWYNIKGKDAEILEFIIKPELRGNLKLMRYVIARNWTIHPFLESFSFNRKKYSLRNRKHNLLRYFKKGKDYGSAGYHPANATATTNGGSISERVCGGAT